MSKIWMSQASFSDIFHLVWNYVVIMMIMCPSVLLTYVARTAAVCHWKFLCKLAARAYWPDHLEMKCTEDTCCSVGAKKIQDEVKWLIHAVSQHVSEFVYSDLCIVRCLSFPPPLFILYRHVHRHRPGTTYTACGVNKNAERPVPSDTHRGRHTTLSFFLLS